MLPNISKHSAVFKVRIMKWTDIGFKLVGYAIRYAFQELKAKFKHLSVIRQEFAVTEIYF
jgi:hypothetical protein